MLYDSSAYKTSQSFRTEEALKRHAIDVAKLENIENASPRGYQRPQNSCWRSCRRSRLQGQSWMKPVRGSSGIFVFLKDERRSVIEWKCRLLLLALPKTPLITTSIRYQNRTLRYVDFLLSNPILLWNGDRSSSPCRMYRCKKSDYD